MRINGIRSDLTCYLNDFIYILFKIKNVKYNIYLGWGLMWGWGRKSNQKLLDRI